MIKFKSKSFLYFIITTIKIYDRIFSNKFTIEILCVGDIKIHTRSKMTSMLSSDFDRQNLDLLLAIWTLMTSAETSKLSYNKLKTPWKLKYFMRKDRKWSSHFIGISLFLRFSVPEITKKRDPTMHSGFRFYIYKVY